MKLTVILPLLLTVLFEPSVARAQPGRIIPASSERFQSANRGFNIDALHVTLLPRNRARVAFNLSANAAECAGQSERASPWLHLRFLDGSGRQYDISGVMLLQVPEPRGYYPRARIISLNVIRHVLPDIRSVSAWTGGYDCTP